MKTLARAIRFVPVILLIGTIFFLSHQHGTDMQLLSVPGLDKLAHGFMYALLAAASLYSLSDNFKSSKPLHAGLLTVLFCLLYGMTDEYHQSFIPGREASIGDLAADSAGAAVLVILWLKKLRSETVPAQAL